MANGNGVLGGAPMTTLLGMLHGTVATVMAIVLIILYSHGVIDEKTLLLTLSLLVNQGIGAAGHIFAADTKPTGQ